MKHIIALSLILCAAALNTENATAQSQSLEDRVTALEKELQQLRSETANKNRAMPAGKSGWRRLQTGMSQDQVENLLGPPSKISKQTFWTSLYYGYPFGGEVKLNANSGLVEGWTEP